jgi:Fe-S-cluster containining protein
MVKPCTQCGRCCTDERFMGTLSVRSQDVRRWRRQKRHDILRFVEVLGTFAEHMGMGYADVWIDPVTGNERKRCPFVRKARNQDRYICTIYETRPAVCREFPYRVGQMEYVNCDMLEPGDTDADVDRFMGRDA